MRSEGLILKKGRWPVAKHAEGYKVRSEGLILKKGEVVSEANRRGFIENKLCLLYNQAVKNFFRKEIF